MLSAGDIAFTGYNADHSTTTSGEDEFSFVTLVNLDAGTQILFTDAGWTDSNSFQQIGVASRAVSDGAIRWTATSAVAGGTQIVIRGRQNLFASTGTVTGITPTFNTPGVYLDLSPGGDQVFAYQGTHAAPTLIAGIHMNGAWQATLASDTFSSGDSRQPAALTGNNASVAVEPEVDNAIYNGAVVGNTAAAIRIGIANSSNWTPNNDTPFALPPALTFTLSAPVQATLTTILSTTPKPSVVGQSVAILAEVTPAISGTPTGTVRFFRNGVQLGTATLGSDRRATFSTTALPLGANSLTASYLGDPAYTASVSLSFAHTVNAAPEPTTTVINSVSPTSIVQGQLATVQVTVTSTGGVPSGDVGFYDNGVLLGTVPLSGNTASFQTVGFSQGNRTITATYLGNGSFASSSDTDSILVAAPPAPTVLSAADILFTGYNADHGATASGEDEFSFVLLRDIEINTDIFFTDAGWTDANAFQQLGVANRAVSDGLIRWRSFSALGCGTHVVVRCRQNLWTNTGTVTGITPTFNDASLHLDLSPGGDQVFAFQSSFASPTLIAGLHMNGAWSATLDVTAFNSSESRQPTALAAASLVIEPEVDNARFDGIHDNSSLTLIRAFLLAPARWETDDTNPFVLPPPVPFAFPGCPIDYPRWAASVFPLGSESALTAPGNDSDGDQLTNDLEFFLGLDPLRPDPAPWSTLRSGAEGKDLDFFFTRRRFASGVTATVQRSINLSGWGPADATLTVVELLDLGLRERVRARLVAPTEPKLFLRLETAP